MVELILHGVKEIFIEDVYYQQLPENAYILDCGAHIGLSVIYLKSICPSANIICFEPDNKNFELLQKNIASHNSKILKHAMKQYGLKILPCNL